MYALRVHNNYSFLKKKFSRIEKVLITFFNFQLNVFKNKWLNIYIYILIYILLFREAYSESADLNYWGPVFSLIDKK